MLYIPHTCPNEASPHHNLRIVLNPNRTFLRSFYKVDVKCEKSIIYPAGLIASNYRVVHVCCFLPEKLVDSCLLFCSPALETSELLAL